MPARLPPAAPAAGRAGGGGRGAPPPPGPRTRAAGPGVRPSLLRRTPHTPGGAACSAVPMQSHMRFQRSPQSPRGPCGPSTRSPCILSKRPLATRPHTLKASCGGAAATACGAAAPAPPPRQVKGRRARAPAAPAAARAAAGCAPPAPARPARDAASRAAARRASAAACAGLAPARPPPAPVRTPGPAPLPAFASGRSCSPLRGAIPCYRSSRGFRRGCGHSGAEGVRDCWVKGSAGCSEQGPAAGCPVLKGHTACPAAHRRAGARARARAPGGQRARPEEVVCDGGAPQARSGRGRGRSGGRPGRQPRLPLAGGLPQLPRRRGRRRCAGRRERRGGSRAWLAWRRLLLGHGRCMSAPAAGRPAHVFHGLRSLRRVALLPPSGTPSTARTCAAGHPLRMRPA